MKLPDIRFSNDIIFIESDNRVNVKLVSLVRDEILAYLKGILVLRCFSGIGDSRTLGIGDISRTSGIGDSRTSGIGDISRTSGIGDISRTWWFCLDPLIFLLPKIMKLFGFPNFWLEYLMKVILEMFLFLSLFFWLLSAILRLAASGYVISTVSLNIS